MNKPDILIVVIDSLRADRVSCYGHHRETTPNLDRLAKEGCRFTSTITAAPFSPSSYASLVSNEYPHEHGVNGDTVRIWPDAMPRLPEMLSEQGYTTFCLSNNSFVTPETNAARGFDVFRDMREAGWRVRMHQKVTRRVRRYFGERAATRLTSNRMRCAGKGDSIATMHEAMRIIDAADGPVFGLLILMDPHTQYDKRRIDFAGWTPEVRAFFRKYNQPAMWAEFMAERKRLTGSERQVVLDLYDSLVLHADRAVGLLVEQLRERGRLDRTVLAVTSDHGEAFGEDGVWGHGFSLKDHLTRVPLILRHPDYWPAGSTYDGIVQLHDLHDTCLSLASDGSPRTDEHPFCLTQAGSAGWPGREAAFSEFPRQSKTLAFMREHHPAFEPGVWDQGMWAIRTPDWHYIEYDDGSCELYDLVSDPGQTHSVHAGNAKRCAALAEQLAEHRGVAPELETVAQPAFEETVDETVLERLRSLGYIE